MNETDDKSLTLLPPVKATGSSVRVFLIFTGFVLIAAMGTAGYLQAEGKLAPLLEGHNDATPKFTALEHRMSALEMQVNELNTRIEAIASPTNVESDTRALKPSSVELAHLQSDLAALTANVSGWQTEAAHSRAQAITFMHLNNAALSGRGFKRELAAFMDAVKNDASLKELTGKLEPYAEAGAFTLAELREKLTQQSAAAYQAVAKADAQNWWQRIVAELKGLVSVRAVHGSGSSDITLEAMQKHLAQNDIAAALEDMKILPPNARHVLEDWRKQAEARLAVDDNLTALSDQLVAGNHLPVQEAP